MKAKPKTIVEVLTDADASVKDAAVIALRKKYDRDTILRIAQIGLHLEDLLSDLMEKEHVS